MSRDVVADSFQYLIDEFLELLARGNSAIDVGDEQADPKVLERFAGLGTEPVAEAQVSPEALKTYLESEVKRWDAVIKAAGVKASN